MQRNTLELSVRFLCYNNSDDFGGGPSVRTTTVIQPKPGARREENRQGLGAIFLLERAVAARITHQPIISRGIGPLQIEFASRTRFREARGDDPISSATLAADFPLVRKDNKLYRSEGNLCFVCRGRWPMGSSEVMECVCIEG